jgi:hypothetical protein
MGETKPRISIAWVKGSSSDFCHLYSNSFARGIDLQACLSPTLASATINHK